MHLNKTIIKGIKWTTFGSIFSACLQIIQLAILARLLNPTEFGLMAIVMVVVGFSNMFIDMGVSNAIIYKQNVSENQLTSLFWFNVIIGFIVFTIIVLIAPLIALLYRFPQIEDLIYIASITFIIQPFGQQFMILLQKELQFDKIIKAQTISKFISFIVVLVFAFNNRGIFSVAYGLIVYSILSTILFFFYGRSIYTPKMYFKSSDLKDFLNFGMFQMGEKIIQYFATEFDTILIGRLLGIEMLGVYNVAKNLVSRPASIINPVITKVTFPVMSKIGEDNNKLRAVYLKTMSYLTLVNTPIYFLILILAKPLVFLLVGEEWMAAVPVVQILAVAYLLISIGNPAGSLLLSRGKANVAFYWNLCTFLLYPLFIFIGSGYGINGIAMSIVLLHILFLYPNWRLIVHRTCEAGFKEYTNSILPFLGMGICGFVSTYIILGEVNGNNYSSVLFGGVIFTTFYTIFVYACRKSIFLDIRLKIFSN